MGLAFGYAGESKVIDPFLGFVLGMGGWGYILYEIFAGEAGKLAQSGSVNKYVQQSFKTMRFIVTVGYLPAWLLLWILDGQRPGQRSQPGVQSCRLRQQDCILLGNLGICQGKHR